MGRARIEPMTPGCPWGNPFISLRLFPHLYHGVIIEPSGRNSEDFNPVNAWEVLVSHLVHGKHSISVDNNTYYHCHCHYN